MTQSVDEAITQAALQTGVDRNALERLVYKESRGNINVGWDPQHYTQGVAQVSETVWDEYSTVPWSEAGDADQYKENIEVAAMYLKSQYNNFETWTLALESYNAGPSVVNQVLSGQRQFSPITQNYVAGFN